MEYKTVYPTLHFNVKNFLSILLRMWNIRKFTQSALLPYYREMVLFTWNDVLSNISFVQIIINWNGILVSHVYLNL
jgi:hypothetical protein